MIQKIDHIGIAVHSIDDSLAFFCDTLGLTVTHTETVEAQGVKVAFLPIGEVTLELLEPLSPDSPIAKFLSRRGEGIHHMALGVDDLGGARKRASEAGVRLLSDKPLDGAHGKMISFLHPKDTHGMLLEFCQRRPHDDDTT